ncbi:Nucleotidyltransferase [Serendipita vermifera]|nr:Nucleotidyltransferase [Serendipita vermifera]
MADEGRRLRSASSAQRKETQPTSEVFQFGADFIPFEEEFRLGEDIPRKRKLDQVEDNEPEQKQPRLARYEDGTFTTPWMRSMDTRLPNNAAEFFNTEVKAYADYISPTKAEHALRGLIIQEIEHAAKKLWPDATATAFGSYATSLYLPTGDIDIVVQTNMVSTANKNNTQRSLTQLASILRNAGLAERRRIQVIAARVPIVKFNSVHGGISIDISLNQTTGLAAILVIKKYLEQFPCLKPLILIIKSYLNQRGMNEVFKGGLGSYSIICMAISFLQLHPKIRLGEIDPSENIGVLLVEFFELYGQHMNYQNVGISLNKGGAYFLKMQKGWLDMSKPWLLSISDPTDDSTNDVSRGSFQMLRLRQTLAGAALILKTRLLEVSQEIDSRKSSYHFSLRPVQPIQTVLGRLIAMSPEAIRQRTAIKLAYDSGKLHGVLNMPAPLTSDITSLDLEEAESDMEFSDREPQSLVQALNKSTHALLTDESGEESGRLGKGRPSEDEHESRYTRVQVNPQLGSSGRITNRFEKLDGQLVEYVMSSSEEEADGHDLNQLTSHINKKRQLEGSSPRPGQLRRSSKRTYWAGKTGPSVE